jgi:hypothetical protein
MANLKEMKILAGIPLTEADLSWSDQKVYDKVKKALGKEKVPVSKMADVVREVVKRRPDKYDAWQIVKLFFDGDDNYEAFKRVWDKALKNQKEWEKEASKKAEPAIHKHIDKAIAALEKADAEMATAAEVARKSRSRLYSRGVPQLRGFLSKPISGLKQLKKGQSLGMYYSKDW